MATENTAKGGVSLEATMAGVLALLVDEREARVGEKYQARKTEVLLADAGLAYGEIAVLLGKDYHAVRMAITRARRSKKS
jgi:hypothetical protein